MEDALDLSNLIGMPIEALIICALCITAYEITKLIINRNKP